MNEQLIDAARPVRAGEELDLARLGEFLRQHVEGLEGAVSIEQFPRGHSNLTYLLTCGARRFVLRRPPFGSKVKTAHDMGREHRILSKLSAVWPLAPRPLAFCDDEGVIGAKFYVMERIEGLIVRKDFPSGLAMPAARVRALNESLVDTLVELHSIDPAATGLADLGKPDGYVERQVTGWARRYEGSKTDDLPVVEQVAAWLAAHVPPEVGATLIHNDYKLDNVVLDPTDPTRIIGVLDWEMSTLGDPLMDLGTTLSYWLEPGDGDAALAIRWAPTTVEGSMTRAEIAARYAERTGRDVSNAVFYHAFGLFKTAVVLQQIYYRYKQGLTRDERFATLIWGVQVLAEMAERSIARGRL